MCALAAVPILPALGVGKAIREYIRTSRAQKRAVAHNNWNGELEHHTDAAIATVTTAKPVKTARHAFPLTCTEGNARPALRLIHDVFADTLTYISWSGTQVRFAAASASLPAGAPAAGLSAVLAVLAGRLTVAGLGAGASPLSGAADGT